MLDQSIADSAAFHPAAPLTSSTASEASTAYRGIFCAVTALLCVPFWLVNFVPLVDYPNHLARMFILHHYDAVPGFQARYERLFEPIPNVAMDLIVPFLMNFVDVYTAGKIFLTLIVVLFAYGCHRLARAAHGAPSWLAIPAALFVYNSMLLYGFINFVFGAALFLVAFADWLEFRQRWTVLGVLRASALFFCAYLAHLAAYAFLGFGVAAIVIWEFAFRKRSVPSLLPGIVPLVPPLLAFIVFMRGSGQSGEIVWNSLFGKLTAMLPVFLSYSREIDIAAGTLMLAALLLVLLYAKKKIYCKPMAIAAAALAILFLLCPKVLFTSSGADARFMLAALLLALLSFRFELPMAIGRSAFALVLLAGFIRVAGIAGEWRELDPQISSVVAQFASVEPGSSIYPAFFENIRSEKPGRVFEHAVCYAVIERGAYCPTLFANRGQQPLISRERPLFGGMRSKDPITRIKWPVVFSNYDYVWCCKLSEPYLEFLKAHGRVAAGDGNCVLIHLDKDKPFAWRSSPN